MKRDLLSTATNSSHISLNELSMCVAFLCACQHSSGEGGGIPTMLG